MVTLPGGERVWLAETPTAEKDLVLCVHGMSGAATNWTDFMAELAPDFDCVALDLPGSGFSPPPKTMAGYSVSALAGTVIRLIECLGSTGHGAADQGRGVHLVGNSMGGAVSVRVAARRPDLVKTLSLVSPALPDLKVRRAVLHFPALALPFVGERLVRQWATRYPVENRVAGVYTTCLYDPSCVHLDRFALEVEALRSRDALPYGAASLVGASRTLVSETLRPYPFSLWRAAERVTAPSLVLFGSHDRLVNPRLAARAIRAFRDARVAVLPETGHIGQMEHPGLVAAQFREMVEETRTRAAEAGNSGRRDPVDA
jgi:pimeloyl-ACP methyl ester carboxylesterase